MYLQRHLWNLDGVRCHRFVRIRVNRFVWRHQREPDHHFFHSIRVDSVSDISSLHDKDHRLLYISNTFVLHFVKRCLRNTIEDGYKCQERKVRGVGSLWGRLKRSMGKCQLHSSQIM